MFPIKPTLDVIWTPSEYSPITWTEIGNLLVSDDICETTGKVLVQSVPVWGNSSNWNIKCMWAAQPPHTLIEGHYPDPSLHAAITNLSACCSLAAAPAAAHSHPALITTTSLNIYCTRISSFSKNLQISLPHLYLNKPNMCFWAKVY